MGKWVTDQAGFLTVSTDSSSNISSPVYPDDFEASWQLAIELRKKNDLIGFRRALSKAFNLVEVLLKAEMPSTLQNLYTAMIELHREGLPEVADMLRMYIAEMASRIIAHENPWHQICRFLAFIDQGTLQEVLRECLKCTAQSFENFLGQFHQDTLNIKRGCIFCGKHDLSEEERNLTGFQTQCERSGYIWLQCAVMNRLGMIYISQNRFFEAESMGLKMWHIADDRQMKIRSLDLIARSQYYQCNDDFAEANLRLAIDILLRGWGKEASWGISYMLILEDWLREWGREGEAERLRVQWDDLLGKDDVEELSVEGQSFDF
jgi:hypothetical protein